MQISDRSTLADSMWKFQEASNASRVGKLWIIFHMIVTGFVQTTDRIVVRYPRTIYLYSLLNHFFLFF